jgi:hypothetical protein
MPAAGTGAWATIACGVGVIVDGCVACNDAGIVGNEMADSGTKAGEFRSKDEGGSV